MALSRSLCLVGLMGAGKSTVGRFLAKRLGMRFIDSDKAIEGEFGLRVAEIFERLGEPAFREAERRTIAELLAGPPSVVATGGGAFVDPSTRALMLERSTVLWLKADMHILAHRVSQKPEKRPLLAGQNPREVLERLSQERSPFYAQAHLTFVNNASPKLMAERIAPAVERLDPASGQ